MSKTNKRVLGRGLDAILKSPDTDITAKDISGNYVAGAIAEIAYDVGFNNPSYFSNNFQKKDATIVVPRSPPRSP